MEMKIRALGRNVVVRSLEQKKQTESGIILSRTDEAQRGQVINVGTEVKDDEVKEGDIVLVNWKAAHKIGDDLYKLSVDEIIGVFEE
jgi:co-chaperonin GroES (HSP10)